MDALARNGQQKFLADGHDLRANARAACRRRLQRLQLCRTLREVDIMGNSCNEVNSHVERLIDTKDKQDI